MVSVRLLKSWKKISVRNFLPSMIKVAPLEEDIDEWMRSVLRIVLQLITRAWRIRVLLCVLGIPWSKYAYRYLNLLSVLGRRQSLTPEHKGAGDEQSLRSTTTTRIHQTMYRL